MLPELRKLVNFGQTLTIVQVLAAGHRLQTFKQKFSEGKECSLCPQSTREVCKAAFGSEPCLVQIATQIMG